MFAESSNFAGGTASTSTVGGHASHGYDGGVVSKASSQQPAGADRSAEDPILPRVAAGDRGAMRMCLDRFGGLVWSLARRQLASPAEVEDAVQDIFLDVWKSAARFDGSVASEVTFVAMIARRRLIDRLRRVSGSREKTVLEDTTPPAAPRDAVAVDQSDDVSAAVEAFAKLSEDQQRVLRLSIQQGLSHERIAGVTGMPLGTVKTHARRGLMRLRELAGAGGES